ncbi:hypothetical protein O3M35_012049 [Rhynocoris fuscipes]|uniref:PPIase cyclophilin-type domain-containing protein n=1 Tax=Rhynocoris fuscipes TaxID=488301 RepID=A0AAW1CSB1_9HEMI
MLGEKNTLFRKKRYLIRRSVLKRPENEQLETTAVSSKVDKVGKQEEKVVDEVKKVTIKVRGSVTEPKSWAAKYFTQYVIKSAPERYTADVEFLFEAEWIYMRRKLFGEGITVPGIGEPLCAVWIDDEYVGDDVGLGTFLLNDKHIGENVLLDLFGVNVMVSTDAVDYCPRFLERAYVYFNVKVNNKNYGRLLFEIFNDMMPQSCERFLRECIRYNGCKVHRIAHDGWFESGKFDKEEPPLREKRKQGMSNVREGMLSLVNYGRTNCKSSQFLVTFTPATFLDPYQCPIGALLDGIEILERINSLQTNYGSPLDDVILENVNILYAPHDVVQRNHLITLKAVLLRPNVWLEQEEMKKEVDEHEDDVVWIPRIDTVPKFNQLNDKLEIDLNDIRLQLYKENKALRDIINEPRFKHIVKNVMEIEKAQGKRITFTEEEISKEGDEKWFKILLNADSEFELFYQPVEIQEICEEWKDVTLRKLSLINNPTVLELLQNVQKRELAIVFDIIKRLLNEAINISIQEKSTEIYKEPILITQEEYARPLGEQLDILPKSMQDILIEEVCNLSDSAFNLFRITLKQMLENISDSKLYNEPSISGDLNLIIKATKSYLNAESLSEIDIDKRKESLIEDVSVLAESMMSVQKRIKSELLPSPAKEKVTI